MYYCPPPPDYFSALIATYEGATLKYHQQDHLSVRLTTDTSGNILAQQGHYAFGEQWYAGAGSTKWQFTTYERDSESGLDQATFRYDSSRIGRFTSPDLLGGSIANPQSLNRYAYVNNDPVNLADPLGLIGRFACAIDGECAIWSGGGTSYWDILDPNPNANFSFSGTWVSHWVDTRTDRDREVGNESGYYTWAFVPDPFQGGGDPQQQKFKDCLKKHGDAEAQANLTFEGFQAAGEAADAAEIDQSAVLALWANENSLQSDFPAGQEGAVGPIQIRERARQDLQRRGQLPSGHDTDLTANLTAGALYYAMMSSHYNVPETRAAGAYNMGPRRSRTRAARRYQRNFNRHRQAYTQLVNCVRE